MIPHFMLAPKHWIKGVRWSKASEKSLFFMTSKLICQSADSHIILLKVHFVQVLLKNLLEIPNKQ
jgi:hypothetical protein